MKKLNKAWAKRNRKTLLIGMIVTAILVSAAFFAYFSFFAVAPKSGWATYRVLDKGHGNLDISDKAEIDLYEVDISGMDGGEREDLDLDDYERVFKDKRAADVNYFLKEEHLYLARIEFKDTIIWDRPEPGENIILTIRQSSIIDCSIEDRTLDDAINNSDSLDYTARVVVEENEGVITGYDYAKKANRLVWFNFTFDWTAQESFCRVDDYYNDKRTNGDTLSIGVSGNIEDNGEYDIVFANNKETDYSLRGYDIGFGFYNELEIIA